MDSREILEDWYGGDGYRELELGEKITPECHFIQDGKIYPATDIGTGVYTSHHFPHYTSIQPHHKP